MNELLKELAELKAQLEAGMDTKAKNAAKEAITSIEAKIAELETAGKDVKALTTSVDEVKAAIAELKDAAVKNQTVIDKFVLDGQRNGNSKKAVKSFGEAFNEAVADAFETKAAEIKNFQNDRSAKLTIDLKAVATMTIGNNLTGDPVASYNPQQALVPANKVNFRDLVRTVQSPTGLYVTYRETGGEGGLGTQTEGSAKGQIDYDLTEVKSSLSYIAGFARFSKQLMYNLPFLQGTLANMLLRDFYKKENTTAYNVVKAGASGSTTLTGTVYAEQLIQLIATQLAADFNASYFLVSPASWSTILSTKPNDYSIPGGVMIDPNGNIRVAGVPVIAAPWVEAGKVQVIDTDFIERVEGESLKVEFSYEDSDNFQKNLITARVECFEVFNLLRTDAHIYATLGSQS